MKLRYRDICHYPAAPSSGQSGIWKKQSWYEKSRTSGKTEVRPQIGTICFEKRIYSQGGSLPKRWTEGRFIMSRLEIPTLREITAERIKWTFTPCETPEVNSKRMLPLSGFVAIIIQKGNGKEDDLVVFQKEDIAAALKNDLAFLEIISDLSELVSALWMSGQEDDLFQWTSCGMAHPCVCDVAFKKLLERNCRNDRPSIFFETDYVFYGLMRVGAFYVALGPAIRNIATDGFAASYAREHGLASSILMKKISLTALTRYMDLVYCHFSGSAIAYEEISIDGAGSEDKQWITAGVLEEYQLSQSENDRNHRVGIDFEDEMMRLVKIGDVEALKKLIGGNVPDVGQISEIVSEKNKEMEYLTVSLLTLLTRAAIEGGLRSEEAYELGDIYLKRLAQHAARGNPFMMLGHHAILEFAERVRKVQEDKRSQSYVEACKSYIEENLRKDISVGDIGPAIGISRTYLTHLFRDSEGITVQQYIQREKCRHAERLLKHSDYPIAMIAQYLGFSSQSYFGSCFRNWYAMTPSAYRRANRK